MNAAMYMETVTGVLAAVLQRFKVLLCCRLHTVGHVQMIDASYDRVCGGGGGV